MSDTPKSPAAAGGRAGMRKELPERFRSYKHVWVAIEFEHGVIHPVSLELLGEGRTCMAPMWSMWSIIRFWWTTETSHSPGCSLNW